MENKRQHYVPQFYFRLFSKDGKQIEVYNLKRQQSFTSPIGPMCAKNYFYSKNSDIEKVFSNLEGRQSNVMNFVIDNQKLPDDPKEYLMLLSFICLQHTRTESSKMKGDQTMKLFSDEVVQSVLGPNPDYEIVFPALHLLKMQRALQSIPLIGDLISVILINKTQKDFIFSDNPVVFHNTYLNRVRNFGVLGLQSPGLQIFCPLNNKIMLMLYDPKFYSINIKADYTLEINDESDIESLNALQFLNCNENIFFSDNVQENKVEEIHKKIKHLIGKRKMTKKIISLPDENGRKRDLVHFYEERPDYDLKLSFVKLNTVSDVGTVRNQDMVNKIQKDMDNYDLYQSSKFLRLIYKVKMVLRRLKYRLLIQFQ